MCHEICNLYFFHDSNPSGLLINSLNYLWIISQFRWDIPWQSCLCSVQHTTESKICHGKSTFYVSNLFFHDKISPYCPFNSSQSPTRISILTPRWAVCLCGVMHTVEIVSKEWCTLRRISLRSDAHCGDCLQGVMHTTETVSTVWCTPRRLSPQCDAHCGDWLCSGMHTAKIVFTEWYIQSSILAKSKKNSKIC